MQVPYTNHSSSVCAKPNSTNAQAVIASQVMERTMIDFMPYPPFPGGAPTING